MEKYDIFLFIYNNIKNYIFLKTLKQHIRLNKLQYKILKDYSHYSNNLYNYSLYVANQHFKQTGKYIGIKNLEDIVKLNDNYKLLPIQTAQQTIRLLDQNYRAFFSLLRKKSKGEYDDKIQIPKYKKKGNCFNVIFTNQNSKLKNNKLTFYKGRDYKILNNNKLEIDFTYKIDGKIKQIMFQPKYNGKYFIMYVNYEENKKQQLNLNKSNYLSIDLGINNFCACIDTLGHSFLMNGKPLKSYNRWYNKQVAEVKSELKLKNNKNWSNYLQKITMDRENWIDNYFNQIVSKLTNHCIKNDMGNVVIGYNEGWKNECNMGKINNQKFYSIPHLKFKLKLENKCNEIGINFIYHEESYTSKCSLIDLEPIKKQEFYLGKRVKRGLFQTDKGIKLNADINGSGNILRKVIGDAWLSQPIVDLMLNPVKINFYKKISIL